MPGSVTLAPCARRVVGGAASERWSFGPALWAPVRKTVGMGSARRFVTVESTVLDGEDPTVVRAVGAGVDDWRRYVTEGGTVIVVPEPGDEGQRELTGVVVVAAHAAAEWWVSLPDRPEAARLDPETAVRSRLVEMCTVDADVEVLAGTSVGFRTVPVITVRALGRGRVVAVGLADLDVLEHGLLGRYVRRVLDRRPRPSRTFGVGVVGYGPHGGMGYIHGLAASETAGLRFVAAADPVPERRAAAMADFPDAHVHVSVDALAADDAVDVAVVATPPSWHADLAVALLEKGKHVVVEKPMCLTVADADRMMAAAAANERVLTVHQSRRWDTDFLAVKRAVDRGLVGDVFNIETFVGGFEHPCRAWHSEESISGGAVYDWGSHHVDWILALFGGPPTQVVAHSHKRVWHDVTNADQITVWMHWVDGREATFRQSDIAGFRRPKFLVQGTAGTLEGHYRPLRVESLEPGRGYAARTEHHAEAPVELRFARYETGYGAVEQVLPPAPHPGWGFHRNLADHLILGEPLAVPPSQSRAVVRVLEAAQRAGANGSAIVELGEEPA